MPRRPTARQALALSALPRLQAEIEAEFSPAALRASLPPEWHRISDNPTVPKVRVTIRIDSDVVKLFRAMGPGWQTRINRVLRSFALCRLAGLAMGPEIYRDPNMPCPTCGGHGEMDFDTARDEILDRIDRLAAARKRK